MSLRHAAPRRLHTLVLGTLLLTGAGVATAEWLSPDATYRDALQQLRYATRDTAGHGDDVARLDTLAVALLRLGRTAEARKLFERTSALKPGDPAAAAALGKLALWADDTTRAESLLTVAGDVDQARADLYATRLRRGAWSAAAAMAPDLNDDGRVPLLEALAEGAPMSVSGDRASLYFERIWPAPLVKARIGGTQVLLMIDTSTPGLLLDPIALRQYGVRPVAGQRLAAWGGTRVAVRNAIAPKLQIEGITWTNVPAGVISLRKLSLNVNPQSAPVAGVIGLSLLRSHDVTFDFQGRRLTLEPRGTAKAILGTRVPFELWGEDELTVWGSINGGRRMAMVLATGLPEAGVGAPDVVFDELGLKPGGVSKLVKGAGAWLGGRPWAQLNVPTVQLGSVAFDKQPGWSGAMEPIEMWRHGVRRDALLGPGVLRGRKVTIDWTRRDLVFED
jgi:hypothetical protein